MPDHNPKIFTKSLLAAAVLSLSGCASAPPRMDDVDLSPIGEGILTAGRATAEVGIHAWDVSMYLLGFSDKLIDKKDIKEVGDVAEIDLDEDFEGEFEGEDFFSEDMDEIDTALLEEMDEIDEAMLEDDALMPDDTLSPVDIDNATASFEEVLDSTIEEEMATLDELGEDPFLTDETAEDSGFISEDEFTTASAPTKVEADIVALDQVLPEFEPRVELPVSEEFVHEVGSDETLWDIAKKTTGDANNWHVLADVNDLNQNAEVFAGQNLIIPAKMLKPGFIDATNTPNSNTQIASNDILIDTSNIGGKKPQIVASADTAPATPQAPAPAAALPVPGTGETIELNTGETLWDFAKRTTGDATNWQAIAGHNNFSEKQAVQVYPGQNIVVPDNLIKPELTLANNTNVEQDNESQQRAAVIAAIEKANKSAIDASGALIAEASSLGNEPVIADETQPITIVEATFKTDPNQQPVKIVTETEQQPVIAVTPQPDLSEVMVSGTYYPKAIYNDADLSSSLLMRVSPGTSLKVSNAEGNWIEVETSKGKGFLHKRDIK